MQPLVWKNLRQRFGTTTGLQHLLAHCAPVHSVSCCAESGPLPAGHCDDCRKVLHVGLTTTVVRLQHAVRHASPSHSTDWYSSTRSCPAGHWFVPKKSTHVGWVFLRGSQHFVVHAVGSAHAVSKSSSGLRDMVAGHSLAPKKVRHVDGASTSLQHVLWHAAPTQLVESLPGLRSVPTSQVCDAHVVSPVAGTQHLLSHVLSTLHSVSSAPARVLVPTGQPLSLVKSSHVSCSFLQQILRQSGPMHGTGRVSQFRLLPVGQLVSTKYSAHVGIGIRLGMQHLRLHAVPVHCRFMFFSPVRAWKPTMHLFDSNQSAHVSRLGSVQQALGQSAPRHCTAVMFSPVLGTNPDGQLDPSK